MLRKLFPFWGSHNNNTKVTGYPKCWKTLELISWNYWWSQISRYRAIYEHLQPLSLDQASKILSNRRAPPTANPG